MIGKKRRVSKRLAARRRAVQAPCIVCDGHAHTVQIFPDNGQNVAAKLLEVFELSVTEGDPQSNGICTTCLTVLNFAYGFMMARRNGRGGDYLRQEIPDLNM